MNTNLILPSPRLLASALLLAAPALAQVTDPPIVTPYGAPCGVWIDVVDTVQPNGDHGLDFTLSGDPFQISLLALGFTQVSVPLPSGCDVLVDPAALLAGLTDAGGLLSVPVTLPGFATGNIYAQAAALDASNAIETSNGLDLLFPGQSPTVDPTTDETHPCYYIQTLNWNFPGDGVPTVSGRVRWPSSSCDSTLGPPVNRPIVIFLHGNNMSNQDHDYLMAHLARNGFVTCSIANGDYLSGTNEGRALQAISYLNAMHASWQWSSRLSNDVVFMGHSRGGEAAITAARLLSENPSLAFTPYDVDAVVSIAPTDGGSIGAEPKEDITGLTTRSFLGIYGSRDPDVRGVRLEDPLTGPENTVFAIYDRAGTEASNEGLLLPANNLTKSLVFVDGATHRGFMDGCNLIDGGTIGCETHKDVARGYINAFLRWHVFGDSAYAAYFDGGSQPTAVRLEGIDIWTQFDDTRRRVVDNFEQGGLLTNTMGGYLSAIGGVAQIAEGQLWQLDEAAPHDTRGLRVKWQSNTASLRWELPAATLPFVGSQRDVSGFGHLSLRVAQDYLDAWNTPGQDVDFTLRLVSGGTFSSGVQISDFGRVPYPAYFYTHPYPYPAGDFTKTAMHTIRVPLDAFAGVDLTDVWNVVIDFDVPGSSSSGSVVIDSVQFVN